jgi:hypothetical protein
MASWEILDVDEELTFVEVRISGIEVSSSSSKQLPQHFETTAPIYCESSERNRKEYEKIKNNKNLFELFQQNENYEIGNLNYGKLIDLRKYVDESGESIKIE